MRVLMLTQVVVTRQDGGAKIKTWQVFKHLAEQHRVLYCSFARNGEEREAAETVRAMCDRVVTVPLRRGWFKDIWVLMESLMMGDSFLLRRDDDRAMQKMVQQLLGEEKIEVIHVDQLNMMRFVPEGWPGVVILDEHNAVWRVVERLYKGSRNPFMRWLLGREWQLVAHSEGEVCRRASIVLAVSEQDRQTLQEVAGSEVEIEVLPIMVDVVALETIWQERRPEPMRLLSIGTLFWPPNSEGIQWWLEEGYNQLRESCPEVSYDIVGARPPRKLRKLAGRHPGVEVYGYVTDARPFWKQATALVVPLLAGGGVRVKILEAMAMGVPVISTSIGCEGLAVEHNRHLLIADTAEELAQACARVLRGPELGRTLAEHARRLMLEQYDCRVVLPELDRMYRRWEK